MVHRVCRQFLENFLDTLDEERHNVDVEILAESKRFFFQDLLLLVLFILLLDLIVFKLNVPAYLFLMVLFLPFLLSLLSVPSNFVGELRSLLLFVWCNGLDKRL